MAACAWHGEQEAKRLASYSIITGRPKETLYSEKIGKEVT
jgi:hypothetical protein